MNKALQIGARQQSFDSYHFDGWRSMGTAPRDGTWVELKCTYGVAPWYCVARWTDEATSTDGRTGEKYLYKNSKPSWQKPEGGGPFSERSLHWRPYVGEVASYTDPTGGMQNDMAYWRGAVANKYGLPLDHFEEIAAQNAKRNAKTGSLGLRNNGLPQITAASPANFNYFPFVFGATMLAVGFFVILIALAK